MTINKALALIVFVVAIIAVFLPAIATPVAVLAMIAALALAILI